MFLLGEHESYLVCHARPTTEENEPRANSVPSGQWLAFGNYPRGVDRRSIFIEAWCERDWFRELREYMATLKGLKAIVLQLREQRTNLVNQIRRVDAALAVLGKLERRSSLAKPVRKISGAARSRIAAAQKARWAKWRARKKR
jgi:hypothetical protein